MAFQKSHRMADLDAAHSAPCVQVPVVMAGCKQVLAVGKPVRTVANGFNSGHILPPPPPVGCKFHIGFPNRGSETVFAQGTPVIRVLDAIEGSCCGNGAGLPCTRADYAAQGTVFFG